MKKHILDCFYKGCFNFWISVVHYVSSIFINPVGFDPYSEWETAYQRVGKKYNFPDKLSIIRLLNYKRKYSFFKYGHPNWLLSRASHDPQFGGRFVYWFAVELMNMIAFILSTLVIV